MVAHLGWVDCDFGHSTVCPVLLGRNWAELAVKLGKMAVHPKSKLTQPRYLTTSHPVPRYLCRIRHADSMLSAPIDGDNRDDPDTPTQVSQLSEGVPRLRRYPRLTTLPPHSWTSPSHCRGCGGQPRRSRTHWTEASERG